MKPTVDISYFVFLKPAAHMISDDFGFKVDDVANIDRIIDAIQDLVREGYFSPYSCSNEACQ